MRPTPGRCPHRGKTGNVDKTLCGAERFRVERCDACRHSLDEPIEFGIGHRAVDVAVTLCKFAINVIGTKEYLERAASSDQTRQPRHWSSAWDKAGADLPLRKNRLFPAGKPHVAGEREFAAHAGSPATDRCDGNNRSAAQSNQHVRQRLQSSSAPEETPPVSRGNPNA